MNKYTQSTPQVQPPPPPSYSDRQFLHTYAAGAFLPLVQASITAVLVMLGTAVLLYVFNVLEWIKPALILGVFTWVTTWLYLQRRWINLTQLETFLNMDLNRDNVIGEAPKAEQFVIRLDEITPDRHYRSRTMVSEISKEKLTIVARGLLNGIPFTERRWTGDGKPLSVNEFRALRSTWIKHGFIEVVSDKDHRQGFDLTEQGWAVLEKIAGPMTELEEEQDDVAELTPEELEANAEENQAYAEKYKSQNLKGNQS